MIEMYFPEFCELYTINFLNLVSPGAGCLLMIRNSTLYSRRVGVFTAFGLVASSLIHKSYSLLGFGLIVSQTPWLFYTIKYVGAAYLGYLGIKTFVIRPSKPQKAVIHASPLQSNVSSKQPLLSRWGAFRMGFIVDMLNPAASLSFICIVIATVSPTTGLGVRAIYMILLIMTSLAWYMTLALCFSNPKLQAWVNGRGRWVEWIMGGFLIYLSYKLLMVEAM